MSNRIAHISIFWGYQAGIINKLEGLAKTCIENSIPIDFILITTEKEELKKLRYLKVFFIKNKGNPFYKRKKQVDILNKLSSDYSKIIMRYPLFDPVILFFLKNKKNYIFEHHTKEVEELKLKKDKRYLFEKYLGSKWINLFGGIIGVTPEIEQYELQRSNYKGFHTFVPNSIPVSNETLEGKIFDNEILNVIMVANFRPWHGLEKIIDEIDKSRAYNKNKFILHIVGDVNDKKLLTKMQSIPNIKYYGFLEKNQLKKLYKKMDVGLGIFNLEVNNMKESTSLKVREYFANGLLVYTGNIDPAFPRDFKYLIQKQDFKIDKLFNFAFKNKGEKKENIKQESRKYIDSKIVLNRLYHEIIKVL